MTEDFAPRLAILPPPQRRLWDELAAVPADFALYGGTAIALHLGHRQSADFEFFANRPFDPTWLVSAIPFLGPATVTQREPNGFRCIVDRGGAVELSFFGAPGVPRLSPPLMVPDSGLQVASLLDLAAMKVSVVQMSAGAKDYLDVDAILTDGRIDLPTALAGARAIYGRWFNFPATLKALAYPEDDTARRLPKAVKDRLLQASHAVDLDDLPRIVPPGGVPGKDPGSAR
jgi:hypothetical protein